MVGASGRGAGPQPMIELKGEIADRSGTILSVVCDCRMSRRIQVLIIEDEPSVADAIRLILEENGYEAVSVETARAGIDECRRRPFDVIITDFRLPDMSGLDVLRQLREEDSAHPAVIVITAYPTPHLHSEATGLGAIEVLPKPFSPSALLTAVATAVSSHASGHGSTSR